MVGSKERPSASPDPPTNGSSTVASNAARSTNAASNKPAISDIQSRTLALIDIPDTVNDSRIRALVEPYGPLIKVLLRPDHRGAIVEFKDVQDAGKAALGLDGHEITPGRKIEIGTVAAMLKQTPETRTDRIVTGSGKVPKEKGKDESAGKTSMLQPNLPVRRPNQLGPRRGGRGGLGLRRGGLGSSGTRAHDGGGEEAKAAETDGKAEDQGKAKSNADFKAMFLKQ